MEHRRLRLVGRLARSDRPSHLDPGRHRRGPRRQQRAGHDERRPHRRCIAQRPAPRPATPPRRSRRPPATVWRCSCIGQGYTGHTQKLVYVSGDAGAHWSKAGTPSSEGDGGTLAGGVATNLVLVTASAASWIEQLGRRRHDLGDREDLRRRRHGLARPRVHDPLERHRRARTRRHQRQQIRSARAAASELRWRRDLAVGQLLGPVASAVRGR